MADVIISDLNAGTVTSTTMIPASLTTLASTSATVFIQPKDFAQVLSLSSVVSGGTPTSSSLLFGTNTSSGPVVFQVGSLPFSTGSGSNIGIISTYSTGSLNPGSTTFILGSVTTSQNVGIPIGAFAPGLLLSTVTAGTVGTTSLIFGTVTTSAPVVFQAGTIGKVTDIFSLTSGTTLGSTSVLLGALTTAADVSVQVGTLPYGSYRVTNMIGVNSTTTPTSQYQLKADVVELWKPADQSKRYVTNTSVIVNDITTTGANGRDIVAATTASQWVHYYFVGPDNVTSSTLQTRVSLVAPPTGPTLQTSETRWAYAGPIRLNASTQLLPTRISGDMALSNIADGGENRVLIAGGSTTFAAVDCSNYIPPNTRFAFFESIVIAPTSLTAGQVGAVLVRPTGSTELGQKSVVIDGFGAGGVQSWVRNFHAVSSVQSLDYMVDTTGLTHYLDVVGYQVPNR